MSDYERGFREARDWAADIALNHYTGLIRNLETMSTERIRLRVEAQWSKAVADKIRAIEPHR
jgi:hypothetical protein